MPALRRVHAQRAILHLQRVCLELAVDDQSGLGGGLTAIIDMNKNTSRLPAMFDETMAFISAMITSMKTVSINGSLRSPLKVARGLAA